MKIHDLDYDPIERVEIHSSNHLKELLETARLPLIITGRNGDLKFLDDWNLDMLSRLDSKIKILRPQADGVTYFFQYSMMHMPEFIRRIKNSEKLYTGAPKILDEGGVPAKADGLLDLADKLEVPSWIDRKRINKACLWVGAGENRTLLHYDAWDSLQMVASGNKEYFIFPTTESSRMHQYSVFDLKSLKLGKVLHSRIKPTNIQKCYQAELSKVKGCRGKISPGEIVFIPAGYWHYVESYGLNIAVNFFLHFVDRSLYLKEPLRTYWIKDNIMLQPFRFYRTLRSTAGTLLNRRY